MYSRIRILNFQINSKKRYFSQIYNRHLGIRKKELPDMLAVTQSPTLPSLIKKSIIPTMTEKKTSPKVNLDTIPSEFMNSEREVSLNLKEMLDRNKPHTSVIGLGYHNVVTPYPIKRHILENPKWYTAYTPYQAEISQGRLEAQYNYQTIIQELTNLPVSNASLLDEASTAAEVLNMCYHYKNKKGKKTFILDSNIHPQIREVMNTKADILGVKLLIGDLQKWGDNLNMLVNYNFDYEDVFGMMFSYPNTYGNISVPEKLINFFKKNNVSICANSDILSLFNLQPPSEYGVDICFGTAQRLGVPLFFGGPHPAYLATSKKYMRLMPGRIIGKSVDTLGKECYRLGLQTREQHIRREKATSNICTSQSLLANVVGFYVYYFGKNEIQRKAWETHCKAKLLDYFFKEIGFQNKNENYFDTIHLTTDLVPQISHTLLEKDIILRLVDNKNLCLSMDETITIPKIYEILNLVYELVHENITLTQVETKFLEILKEPSHYEKFVRQNQDFLNCDKFSDSKTETEFLRYVHQLTKKDYTLCEGMIPLGSCTMKLNSVYQLESLGWDSVQSYHPYTLPEYVKGYHYLFLELGKYLKDITGFSNVSFQSNSGAMGEYSGLLCIKKYHQVRNDFDRNICLIPKSAHGTNFSSASLAGFKVISYDDDLDWNDFIDLVSKIHHNLGCLMITYPGTNGIFQSNIQKITELIHNYGGLVYLDGANMNALVGLVKPGEIGADVCHLNLHKTFCIPHGGGGPGMGPILCNDKLGDYLPSNIFQTSNYNTEKSIGMITGSLWSSASLLTIPYQYILGMGEEGLREASKIAILNANYMKDKLKNYYQIIDTNDLGLVAHEFIIDTSNFRKYNITELDIAKRLMDYSFHPPTMSWPRSQVLMFEPTESENKEELDRLINALISINKEIQEIIKDGNFENNILKNAPHSMDLITDWNYDYSMEKAFFPVPELKENKFWPHTNRINDIEGDKKLLN
jgi:glycine dehydrogenase